MVCPYCAHDSKVTNSRLQKRSNSVWRRRNCLKCGAVWTTIEAIQSATVLKVELGGSLLDFKPETLLISLYEALRHKKTADVDAQYVANTVLARLQAMRQANISAKTIAATAYDVLRHYDSTAAAVYAAQHGL